MKTVGSRQRGAGSSGQTRRRAVVGSGRSSVQIGLSCLLLLAATALPAAAQAQAPRDIVTPPVIRYGKWAAAAVAAGFTAMGIRAHERADDDFRELADYCRTNGACLVGPDGRYGDPAAEARYRDVVRGDRAARAWLGSGQAALVGSAILFVLELKRQRGPANIPYSGLIVEPGRFGTLLGVRVPVGR